MHMNDPSVQKMYKRTPLGKLDVIRNHFGEICRNIIVAWPALHHSHQPEPKMAYPLPKIGFSPCTKNGLYNLPNPRGDHLIAKEVELPFLSEDHFTEAVLAPGLIFHSESYNQNPEWFR
jgi:hypothetical protein